MAHFDDLASFPAQDEGHGCRGSMMPPTDRRPHACQATTGSVSVDGAAARFGLDFRQNARSMSPPFSK